MEFLVLLLLIALIAVVLSLKNSISKQFQVLENKIWQLQQELAKDRYQQSVSTKTEPVKVVAATQESPSSPIAETIAPTIIPEVPGFGPSTGAPFDDRDYITDQPIQPDVTSEAASQTSEQTKEIPEPVKVEENYWRSGFEVLGDHSRAAIVGNPLLENEISVASKIHVPKPPKPGFFQKNPDLEKFIGENLVSKIGIAILVLAIAYFVKYAIDNNWIGPVGRVGVGVLCAGILIGLGHLMRRNYHAFSSVLVGGGLAVLYFAIALAYQQFHLFPQPAAFVIMLVITGFAVALSVLYDRQELAIIALAGGFAVPFMVSNNSGNFRTLFTYLLLLNAGLLVIAYTKAWRLLNLLAFLFTTLLFSGWLFALKADTPATDYRSGFLFASIFYGLFFAINVAHNIREQKKFIASDFGIVLANTALYFAGGLYCLHKMGATQYQGLFSAAMAVLNLGVSYIFFRNRKVDSNILYLLVGLTLSFVSLTAPIQLKGNHITLFWATECVLIYWLYTKSSINVFRYSSALVWLAMLVSLVMDWYAGKGFLTGVFAAACSFLLYQLASGREDQRYLPLLQGAALLILFISGSIEVDNQVNGLNLGGNISFLYQEFYLLAFVAILLLLSKKIDLLKRFHKLPVVLIGLCLLVYVVSVTQYFRVQANVLERNLPGIHFSLHWLSAVLVAFFLYRFYQRCLQQSLPIPKDIAWWLLAFLMLFFVSVEMHLLVNNIFYGPDHTLPELQVSYVRTGLPILWGLCSFAFMFLGMKYKIKTLRIVSLTLFSLTLLKLFLYDIRNISVAGKIAAFFCLGVILLLVSFMYQRLKKIIIEDEQKPLV